MTAISIKNVEKRFGEVQVLQDINLEAKEGEFVSLIGPSGCGKTTLLRIIAGLEKATKGEVAIFGLPPRASQKRRDIGVAFQSPALVPSRTALKNVDLTIEITHRRNGTSPTEMLSSFGLSKFANHYPHQLSGGMQQRVNIAASMIHNPKVLLMDEPFGALDEITREQMAIWLSAVLTESTKTVVFVTHSVDEAVILSDRIVVMSPRPGQIYQDIAIDLPHPRNRALRTARTYLDRVAYVREVLYEVMNGEYV